MTDSILKASCTFFLSHEKFIRQVLSTHVTSRLTNSTSIFCNKHHPGCWHYYDDNAVCQYQHGQERSLTRICATAKQQQLQSFLICLTHQMVKKVCIRTTWIPNTSSLAFKLTTHQNHSKDFCCGWEVARSSIASRSKQSTVSREHEVIGLFSWGFRPFKKDPLLFVIWLPCCFCFKISHSPVVFLFHSRSVESGQHICLHLSSCKQRQRSWWQQG